MKNANSISVALLAIIVCCSTKICPQEPDVSKHEANLEKIVFDNAHASITVTDDPTGKFQVNVMQGHLDGSVIPVQFSSIYNKGIFGRAMVSIGDVSKGQKTVSFFTRDPDGSEPGLFLFDDTSDVVQYGYFDFDANAEWDYGYARQSENGQMVVSSKIRVAEEWVLVDEVGPPKDAVPFARRGETRYEFRDKKWQLVEKPDE